jgi:CheY-like chemotaxis protein
MLQALPGTRILIVEDEHYIVRDERAALEAVGAVIVAAVDNEAAAFAVLLQRGVDIVLLDWNLQDRRPAKLAAYLQAVPVPFMMVTGYERDYLPAPLRTSPYLQKPFDRHTLVKELVRVLSTGASTPS